MYAVELADLALLVDQRNSQGRAAFDLADVARLATIGAVDTVVLDVDAHVPGTVDDATGAVEFAEQASAENYGVTDEIARRVRTSRWPGGRRSSRRRADGWDGSGDSALHALTITP